MKRIGDYTEDDIKNQTPLGLGVKIVAGVIALVLLFGAIGFVMSWIGTAAKVVSPANVKEQWRFAYDYDASLEAIATQWCTIKQVEVAETNPDYKSQRTTQRIAVENNYNAKSAEFNGRLADAFRAKLVAPSDVPRTAPLLTAKTKRLCPEIA